MFRLGSGHNVGTELLRFRNGVRGSREEQRGPRGWRQGHLQGSRKLGSETLSEHSISLYPPGKPKPYIGDRSRGPKMPSSGVWHLLAALQGATGVIFQCPRWAGKDKGQPLISLSRPPLQSWSHSVSNPVPHCCVIIYSLSSAWPTPSSPHTAAQKASFLGQRGRVIWKPLSDELRDQGADMAGGPALPCPQSQR